MERVYMSKNIKCPTCKEESTMHLWDEKTKQFYGQNALSITLASKVGWSEHICPKCTSRAYNNEVI
ncbi:hypothetical protein CQ064_08355 [Bacillus sp. MYb78]|uniref:Uncharacterized protein n=3 Tax=Bacillus thuringiensis TaxID=1428 RepID=A0A9X6VCP8_BACTU|nr:hypothetical protein bthur0002_57900 [Bacillus thuringiensis Bt407]PFB08040.1 hypothetical protein CN398_09980 [Bacillus thuringiensis]PQZ77854.1 hypothetical protein CQ064_08355 [Bacillus sp. MYb78]